MNGFTSPRIATPPATGLRALRAPCRAGAARPGPARSRAAGAPRSGWATWAGSRSRSASRSVRRPSAPSSRPSTPPAGQAGFLITVTVIAPVVGGVLAILLAERIDRARVLTIGVGTRAERRADAGVLPAGPGRSPLCQCLRDWLCAAVAPAHPAASSPGTSPSVTSTPPSVGVGPSSCSPCAASFSLSAKP